MKLADVKDFDFNTSDNSLLMDVVIYPGGEPFSEYGVFPNPPLRDGTLFFPGYGLLVDEIAHSFGPFTKFEDYARWSSAYSTGTATLALLGLGGLLLCAWRRFDLS
jgi:hypothetical protein